MDPTLFLSVYLLLYPVMQWGLGGWLLAPEETEDPMEGSLKTLGSTESQRNISQSLRHNVLNNKVGTNRTHRRGLVSADEGLYMTEMYVYTRVVPAIAMLKFLQGLDQAS